MKKYLSKVIEYAKNHLDDIETVVEEGQNYYTEPIENTEEDYGLDNYSEDESSDEEEIENNEIEEEVENNEIEEEVENNEIEKEIIEEINYHLRRRFLHLK